MGGVLIIGGMLALAFGVLVISAGDDNQPNGCIIAVVGAAMLIGGCALAAHHP